MSGVVAIVEPVVPALGRERRLVLPGAGFLSAATLGSGVLAYAFLVLAARTLGPERYGKIGVLWAAMFLVVIVLFRPLEQTAARAIADRLARGEEAVTVVRSVTLILLALTGAVAVGTALAWDTITQRLFLGSDALTLALLAGIAGYGVAYVVRGVCGGVRWFGGYGLLLSSDAVTRLVVGLPLLFVAATTTAAAAVASAGIAGALLPLACKGGRFHIIRSGGGEPFHARSALVFAAPAAVIAFADQVLVNGGILLVMLGGGQSMTRTAGIVFAATMLVRVPVFVFQGVAASLLPNLTRMHAIQETRAFRRAITHAVALFAAIGLAIAVAAASAGPNTMRLLFGADFHAGRLALGLLGIGVGCYLAAATFSQALLALDRVWPAAATWMFSATLFLGLYFVLPGDALLKISESFAIGMAAGALLLGVELAYRSRSTP